MASHDGIRQLFVETLIFLSSGPPVTHSPCAKAWLTKLKLFDVTSFGKMESITANLTDGNMVKCTQVLLHV